MPPSLLNIFYPLLQAGVMVEVEVGCSIQKLLTEQFGIPADYISKRITTLFLNSKAVDDAKTALVNDGSVLALSGAMPGLVGATMRSGGYYSAMRSAINFSNEIIPEAKRGIIKIKLFNLLLEELGSRILMRGIQLTGHQFKSFIHEQPKNMRLIDCVIDGVVFHGDCQKLAASINNDQDMIIFKIHFGD
jgi:hypothetical protein